jgi:hypothetical protein
MPNTMHDIAEFLFKLLDDIDTAGDIAKGDDRAFRKMVETVHRRRFEVAETDGHVVTFPMHAAASETFINGAGI